MANKSLIPFNQTLNRTAMSAVFEIYYVQFILNTLISTIFCSFAVISNSLCFMAICTYPPLKRRGNILVANLVLLNILLGLTVHPITIVVTLGRQYPNFPFPTNFCDWLTYYYFILHSFVWHECLLAVNRFIAIVLPHHYKAVSKKTAIFGTLLLGYVISFAVNAYPLNPLTQNRHIFITSHPFGNCLFNPAFTNIYPSLQPVLGMYLPLSIIGLCYGSVFLTALMKRMFAGNSPTRIIARARHVELRRLQLARMLFGCFIWNSVTYLPHPVLTYFIKDFYVRFPTAFFYVRWALLAGPAGSTIVYAILHRDFRKGILSVLMCKMRQLVVEPAASTTKKKGAVSESRGGARMDTLTL